MNNKIDIDKQKPNVLWNRLKYVLSPQFDVYKTIAGVVKNRVADIGFGTGFGMHLLSVKAEEVYGYETDIDAIKFARSVFPFKNMYFEYGNIVHGISTSYFDYVVMVDVLEHIEQEIETLRNVKKMLKDSGIFIMSTPNRLSRYRKAETHCREYAPEELKNKLKKIFLSVSLRNYKLEPLTSQYENPILAVCHNEEYK